MPAERTSTTTGEPDVAIEGAAQLLTAPGGDLAREAHFWRARAEELAAQMEVLQTRLLALARHLPTRYATLLASDAAALEREIAWPDPLAGWRETTTLEPASIASELALLWLRLGPPPRR